MLLHLLALALSPGARPRVPGVPSVSTVRPALSIPAAASAAVLASVPLPSFADSAVDAFFQSEEVKQLGVFFAQTVISWGVPAAVVLIVVLTAGGRGGDPDEDELPAPLAKALGVSKEPQEFLKIELLNKKLQSFDYSFDKATVSKESAIRASREASFRRVWAAELSNLGLSSKQLEAINKATERYRKAQGALLRELERNQRKLRAATVAQRVDAKVFDAIMKLEGGEAIDDPPGQPAKSQFSFFPSTFGSANASAANGASSSGGGGGMMAQIRAQLDLSSLNEEVGDIQAKLQALDLQFLAGLSTTVSKDQALALSEALKAKGGDGGIVDVLQSMPQLHPTPEPGRGTTRPPRLFTLSFFGDVTASQVSNLRQEVTAVLRRADPAAGDEVLLVLNTGGGTVTGYGLAAAQLSRLRAVGLRLTVAVEQVAASGGYMMACTADRIVASPFAVLGSIGVIAEQPNVYERLKREGIEFNTITAGKFKRTLTPTKKVEMADLKKEKEDIEQVLTLFKGFVSTNRPGLDIDSVATGEIWFGPDALKKNLVDELVTSDDVLTRHVADGYDVFSVKYMPKPSSPLAALTGAAAGGWQGALVGLVARAILPATPVGGVAADELTRQALGGRPRGAEARWVDDSAPMLRAEGMGGSAEQPSWGWDDDFA